MFQIFQERRSTTLLAILFLVSFTLMSLSVRRRGGTTLIAQAGLSLAGPFMDAAGTPKRWTQDFWENYIALRGLRKENIKLDQELATLRGNSIQIRELQNKVERLEGLMGGFRDNKPPLRLAQIVGRAHSPFGRSIIVDLGSIHGVRRNMPVIHQNGLVGRVSRIGRRVSQILLITDSRNSVDILVQRSREQGIFSISSESTGEVRYMPSDADVKVGDLLISSGLGGVFPKGLSVARVTETRRKEDRLFRRVLAAPTVDFNKLEEVLVMMVEQKENPWK